MLCHQMMKSQVESIGPDEPCSAAAAKMREHGVGFLPVCDEGNKVIGTVTDRDIVVRVVADAKGCDTPVREAMTEEVVSCKPSDDVKRAERLMSEHQISRMMCVDDDGCCVGVISLSDVARLGDPPRTAETLRRVKKPSNGVAAEPIQA